MMGTTILGYRLEQLLRDDAVSSVYRGVNHDLGQTVAVRVLAAEFARLPDVRERFLQQARALVALRHPGIVAVLTADTASAQPAVVSELVDGTTLADALRRRGPMAVDDAVGVARRLLESLAYAHQRGVLHGDLRPANVLVGDDGALKIDGFGAAVAVGNTRAAREVVVVGNAEYLSPEQILGQRCDERSDLYGLACVVFELLVGRTPFGDATASSTSDFLVRQAHVQAPVPDLRALRADVSSALDAVLRRALAKSPDDRFRNADAMLAALNEATSLSAPTVGSRAATVASPSTPASLSPAATALHTGVDDPVAAAPHDDADLPLATDDAVGLGDARDAAEAAAPASPVVASPDVGRVATSTSAAVVRKRSGLPWGVVAAVLAVPAVVVVVGVGVGAWWATSPLRAAVIGASADAQHDTTVGYRAAVRRLDDALDANSFVRPFARVAGLAHIDDSLASALSLRAYARARLWERDGGEEDTATENSVMAAVDQAAGQPWTVAAQMIAARLNDNAAEAEAIARHSGVDVHALPIPVRVELGRAFAAQGKIAEMLALADALKDTSDVESLVFAGEAYRRVGDHDRARQSLDAALKIDPNHEASRALRALLILEQEDVSNLAVALDDATTLLDVGQESLGNRQRGDAILARALIGQRLHAGAEKETQRDFDTARQLLRGDAEMPLFEALQAKANAFAAVDGRKAWDTPMQLLGDAIQRDPYRVAPYLQLMNVGARAKKFDVADKAYNDARAVFGDNLSLGLARAMSLLAGDKTEEALGHLQNMLTTNDDAEVYRDIGKVWMKKGDLQKSIQYLKKAAEKVSSRSPGLQANVYTWLGRALAKTEDHAQAKEAYAHALAATTEFPSTYYWLGVTLQALSEGTQAGEAFQNYLRADPDGPYAEDARTRLATPPRLSNGAESGERAAGAEVNSPRPPDTDGGDQNKIAMLFGGKGQVSQLFGADSGGALEAALGGIDGSKVAAGFGTGGLGIRGGGVGTLGTGRIGTRGRGAGDSGGGSGEGGLGARSDRDVTLTQGTPVVLGSLDPELIRRFVREHAGQIRYCYESELTRTPGIAGKIVMKWVINGEGRVMQAQVAETQIKNANVESCLVGKIKTWTFPRPRGGGMVVVNFPFVFRQG